MAQIPCVKSAVTWAEELEAIRNRTFDRRGEYVRQKGGLVDASNFMSPATTAALDAIAARSNGQGPRLVKEGGKFYFVVQAGRQGIQKWEIAESPWYADQFPAGVSFSQTHLVIRRNRSLDVSQSLVNEFPVSQVFVGGQIDAVALTALMEKAKSHAGSQLRDAAGMRNYDLPRNRSIGYIGLLPPAANPITDGLRRDVEMLPRYLGCKGVKFVGVGGHGTTKVDRDPAQIIREQLDQLKKQGIKDAYLNLAAHGSPQGVHFDPGNPRNLVLPPRQLASILDDYKEFNFILDTPACHGGGIAPMMAAYQNPPDAPKGRTVTAFLQTKAENFNQEGRIVGQSPPQAVSTYYRILQIAALQDGKKFGAAHLYADDLAQKIVPNNAEVFHLENGKVSSTRSLQ